MKRQLFRRSRTDDGFSMIEVLVAVLILAIGLLGVAGTQLLSMQQTSNANTRSTATLYAQDLIERVRSNGGTALSASELDGFEALLQRDLGPDADVSLDVDGDTAEVVINWQERDPFAEDDVSQQSLTVRAAL